ncbi:hypothetical protein AAVH_13782, partial [Aphelenchoides avenae]
PRISRCPECSYSTDRQCHFNEHRKTHEKTVLHHCAACLYDAATERQRRQHQAGAKHKKLIAAMQAREQ